MGLLAMFPPLALVGKSCLLLWPSPAFRCLKWETTSALNLTPLIGPNEVNYVERRATSDTCHKYLLSVGDTRSDHVLLPTPLRLLDLCAIINSSLAGCVEDMKTFCENIWHSLTQEQEEKKNHKAWDRISFSFHVAMWVKEPSLS